MSDVATYKLSDKVVLIQVSDEVYNGLVEVLNEGGLLDFDELPDDSFKILSAVEISGPAEIQA